MSSGTDTHNSEKERNVFVLGGGQGRVQQQDYVTTFPPKAWFTKSIPGLGFACLPLWVFKSVSGSGWGLAGDKMSQSHGPPGAGSHITSQS